MNSTPAHQNALDGSHLEAQVANSPPKEPSRLAENVLAAQSSATPISPHNCHASPSLSLPTVPLSLSLPPQGASCTHCGHAGGPLSAQPPPLSFQATSSTVAPFQYNHPLGAFAGGGVQPPQLHGATPTVVPYPSPLFQSPTHPYNFPHSELMGSPVYPSSGVSNEPKRPAPAATAHTTGPLVTAVAVGSMLGLTAAAAVRWLNGSDFMLFPPSSLSPGETTMGESSNDTPTETGTTIVRGSEPRMEDFRAQSEKQTILLQRLEELVAKQKRMEEYIAVTNQSIEDLRRQQTISAPLDEHDSASAHVEIATCLHEIKNELTLIRELLVATRYDTNAENVEHINGKSGPPRTSADPQLLHSRLSNVLDKLDASLTEDNANDPENDTKGVNGKSSLELNGQDKVGRSGDVESGETSSSFSSQPEKTIPLHKAFSEAIQLNPMTSDGRRVSTLSLSSSKPLGCSSALRDALCELVAANRKERLVSGAQLLYLYVVNVASHPRVPRYRKIFCNNESFQQHVADLAGARPLLEAVGFVEREQPQHFGSGSSNSPTSKPATYWEWLPPPQQRTTPLDDGSTNGTSVSISDPTSPSHALQKPWFDDTEATFVERLKEATAALAVLKVASNADKHDLINSALLSAGLRLEDRPSRTLSDPNQLSAVASAPQVETAHTNAEQAVVLPLQIANSPHRDDATTPVRTNGGATASAAAEDGPTDSNSLSVHMDPSLLETPPVSGSILSPPVTKSLMTLSNFSLERPLTGTDPEPSSQLLEFATPELMGELNQIASEASSLADEAEAAMWK
jgi:PUB domain